MGIPLVADGSDIIAVRCKMTDRSGTTVPLMGDAHPVFFEIEGEGEIVGDASIMANPVRPDAGIATVLVRSTCKAGKIKLKARLYWDSLTDGTFTRASVRPAELEFESI